MISSVISRSQLQSLFASNVCKFPVRTKRNISCSGRPSHLRLFIASSKLDFFMSRRVPDGLPNRRSDCGGGMRYQDRVNRHPKGQSTPQYCQELPFRHRWCGGRHAFALSTCRGLPRQEQDKPRGGDARVCKSSRAQRHLFDALRQAINHCCFRQSAEFSASAHGSCPSRARMERIVSGEPLSSVPISAKRNPLRPEFFKAKVSGWDIAIFHLQAESGGLDRLAERFASP